MDTTSNKLAFLDEVICYYIQVVQQYSSFIGDSLLNNWIKYRDLKRKNYFNNIKNNLAKVSEIEKKKKISVRKYEYNDKISLSFYNNLYKELSRSASISLLYMINYYDKIRNKGENLTNEKVSDSNVKISYISLDDGYYAHLRYEKKKLVVNKTSFRNETIIFKSSLKEDSMIWGDEDKTISPYEKRRRRIVEESFDVHKKMDCLMKDSINSSFNLDLLYEVCKLLVDDLYSDLVSQNRERDVFKKLTNMTKEQYGAFSCLTDYDLLYIKFNDNKEMLDDSVLNDLINKSSKIKESKQYVEFNNIDKIMPSIFDLYNVLNNRIINNVVLSLKDLRYRLGVLTSYMTINEVVRYYERLIEIKNDTKYSVVCQKYFVKLIEERFDIPEKTILTDYIKECEL